MAGKNKDLSEDKRELTGQEKLEIKKKKKKKKTALIVTLSIVGSIILLIVIIVIVARNLMKNTMSSTVSLTYPERGSLTCEITVSGQIESEKTIHYYAPASLLIDKMQPVGSLVKKGDKILEFNKESFENELLIAQLSRDSADNSYMGSLQNLDTAEDKYENARGRYWKYKKLVDEQQAVVDELTKEITDANALKSAELQATIAAYQKTLSDYQYSNKDRLAELSGIGYDPTEEEKNWLKEYNDYVYKKQQEINDLSNELSQLSSSAVTYVNQKYLNEQTALLAEYKAEKQTAESEMKSYENTVSNEYEKDNLTVNGELQTMQAQMRYDQLADFENGLVAPFDGVIMAAGFTEADTTTSGAPLITFSSLDDLHVLIGVSKNDLEHLKIGQPAVIKTLGNTYNGKVVSINHMVSATGNGSQVQVMVSIDDPDDNMYLGLDAKCTITTAQIDDCMKVPVESVNVDDQGDFVFVVSPTTLVVSKKYVETGNSSDFDIEIISGIEETDMVVTTYTGTITPGMPTLVSPESMSLIGQQAAGSQQNSLTDDLPEVVEE